MLRTTGTQPNSDAGSFEPAPLDARHRCALVDLQYVQLDVDAGIHRVAQVIRAVDFNYINVFRIKPVARPSAHESERIATIFKALTPVIILAHSKPVFLSKIGSETLLRNAPAIVITRTLRLLFRSDWLRMLFLLPGSDLLRTLLLRAVLFRFAIGLRLRFPLRRFGVGFLRTRAFFLWLYSSLRLCFFFVLGRLVSLFFLLVVLLLLCQRWSSNSERQRQNCSTHNSKYFHPCCLLETDDRGSILPTRSLAQTSRGCIDRASDCFARNNQLNPAILLSSRRVVVGGHWQRVAEASGRN